MSIDNQKKTTIGGQALIEGVMMKGVSVGAMAVRKNDGSIYVEEWKLGEKKWYNKAPFIRGCINFASQLKEGYSCITKSAEISGSFDEEEPTKFDKFLIKTFGEEGSEKVAQAISGIVSFLLIVAMLGVFLFLPSFLFTLIENAVSADISMWKSTFEGVLKLALFIAYMAIVAQMKDIRRTYEYHGAEHKTIACYEAGKELTVENVRPMTRFHPRCGTSFIIITLLVSILVYTLIPLEPGVWFGIENKVLSTLLRVLIKLAGRHSNIITKIISAPGLWTQRLTTREPDDKQIETAIAAMKPCLPKENENDNW